MGCAPKRTERLLAAAFASSHGYFHGETGEGLGASHQTGWTGLLANPVMRRYRKEIDPWSGLDRGPEAAPVDEMA